MFNVTFLNLFGSKNWNIKNQQVSNLSMEYFRDTNFEIKSFLHIIISI